MVREITVVKKPRDDPLIDRPINFPPLENLHLDLMENKRKLKKNLPPIQVIKKKPAISASVAEAAAASAAIASAVAPAAATAAQSEKKKANVAAQTKEQTADDADADADMLNELGAEDGEEKAVELDFGEETPEARDSLSSTYNRTSSRRRRATRGGGG